MRSPLGKECRKLFRKLMAVEFPEYQEDKGQAVPPGWYVWTRQHPSEIWFHITFVINPTRDQFTAEAAWSHDGKMKPYNINRLDEFLSQANGIRFGYLWVDKSYWWHLFPNPGRKRTIADGDDPIEQCLPLVAPAVWDAGEKLKEHLIPVFEKIVQKHGKNPDASA